MINIIANKINTDTVYFTIAPPGYCAYQVDAAVSEGQQGNQLQLLLHIFPLLGFL